MGLFFRNWLEEGYYEEDSMGDLTKLEDPIEILRASKYGNLYEHDGMGLTKVNDTTNLKIDIENEQKRKLFKK